MKRRRGEMKTESSSFPPTFRIRARNTRARMCVFRATISVHKKRFEAGAYKFK